MSDEQKRKLTSEWHQRTGLPVDVLTSNTKTLVELQQHLYLIELALNGKHCVPAGLTYKAMAEKFLADPSQWL